MTDHKKLREALASGTALPVPMTRKQLLQHITDHFAAQANRRFKAPLELEHMELKDLRAAPIAGTIFGEVATALGTAGIATDSTMGSIMDPLKFEQNDMHSFCGCHHPEIDGKTASFIFGAYSKEA